MRRLVMAVLVLAGAAGVPVALAPPAAACSCVAGTPAKYLARANAVFVGTVRERQVSPAEPAAVYVLDVSRVYKGQVRATQEVVTAAAGISCGWELPVTSEPVLVYANGAAGAQRLQSGLCSGTRGGAEVPAAYGAGWAPPPEPLRASPPAGGGGVPPAVWIAAGALLAAGAATLALRRR